VGDDVVLAFAAGFSEPYFLGTVRGITQVAAQRSIEGTREPSPSGKPTPTGSPTAPSGPRAASAANEQRDDSFRANVGIVVLATDDDTVLSLKRYGYEDAWQMPQGGLERGETPEDAARRELEEETGLTWDQVDLLGQYPDWLAYELDAEDRRPDIGRGQVQKWFYVRLRDRAAAVVTDRVDERKERLSSRTRAG
jgi:putative (di)nucleoside polyphosphate hydrolase